MCRTKRSVVDPNPVFRKQLLELEAEIREWEEVANMFEGTAPAGGKPEDK